MLGLMQDWPLLIHRVIDHAATQHAGRPILSRSVEGPLHRTTYAEIRRRARKVAKRLARDGVGLGDRVATLAWNTWRHLEAWYGITGIGAIYHTVNPRLFEEQLVYIMNHAGDRVLLLDLTFVPLVEKLAPRLPAIERYIVLTDAAHMPETTLRNAVRLRGMARRGGRGFRLGELRREHRRRHVLHLGHHRRPEGRALFASLERSARAAASNARLPRPVLPRRRHAGRAAVPCQWLGARLRGADGGRRVWSCPARSSTAPPCTSCSRRSGSPVTAAVPTVWLGAPAASRRHRRQALDPEARRHRRLGLPARR